MLAKLQTAHTAQIGLGNMSVASQVLAHRRDAGRRLCPEQKWGDNGFSTKQCEGFWIRSVCGRFNELLINLQDIMKKNFNCPQ
jgi:hypothetical protein